MNRRAFLYGLGLSLAGIYLPTHAQAKGKTMVVYFSRVGEQYGVGVIKKGNTAITAEIIAKKVGADLCEVKVVNDNYPMKYKPLCDMAKKELETKARPPYSKTVADLSGYDTLFIGAPVWWGDWPMVMYSFFEKEDLSKKTLIPFSTHGGSGLSGFDKKLAAVCKTSRVPQGRGFLGSDAQKHPERIEKEVDGWLKNLAKDGIVFN